MERIAQSFLSRSTGNPPVTLAHPRNRSAGRPAARARRILAPTHAQRTAVELDPPWALQLHLRRYIYYLRI